MQVRDRDVDVRANASAEDVPRKRGTLSRIFRALTIFAFFVVLVVVFVVTVLVVAIASGVSLGTCSSGSHNPIV